jgi:hypothetical protein
VPINIAGLTERNAVLGAIAECDDIGPDAFLQRHGYGPALQYFLHYDGKTYDSKAIAGVAYARQHPGSHVTASDFSGGEATVARALRALGFTVNAEPTAQLTPDEERSRREQLWDAALNEPNPMAIPRGKVRELELYGGAQGIWVDLARTRGIGGAEHGVTISVLHTGKSYPDDLSEDGVIYHYPTTNRPPARDAGEVEATKNAARLSLPVFVIGPGTHHDTRRIYKGWVEDWDDEARIFLVAFQEEPVPPKTEAQTDDDPRFILQDKSGASHTATVAVRKGQAHFKFAVLKRYGNQCAVCEITHQRLIDAAHLCPKREKGSDDARNGLPLCANHHRALDAGLYGIDPATRQLVTKSTGPSLADLRITVTSLQHLSQLPHNDALQHLWRSFDPT